MNGATERDLHEGPALSVELDSYAQHGLETLETILGPATLVVRSGGRWFDEDGAQHDKLHAPSNRSAPNSIGSTPLMEPRNRNKPPDGRLSGAP
jgi:hypothetical protein